MPSNKPNNPVPDVAPEDLVARRLEQYRLSVVFHAAAYKHVSMMERQVFAAVHNNIFGV
jgi:FlaA1/EpsC-like NDP-sugar epimerase